MKINPLLRNMHTLLTENIDGKISMIMRVKKTGLKEADNKLTNYKNDDVKYI